MSEMSASVAGVKRETVEIVEGQAEFEARPAPRRRSEIEINQKKEKSEPRPRSASISVSGAVALGTDDLPAFLDEVADAGVEVVGLSTMPPLTSRAEESRPYFRRLAELARAANLSELSMGTTQDYRVALEEGATFVRVGSALFEG